MGKTKAFLIPLVVIPLAVAHLTCNQAILTAPPGSTMFLTANPLFIPATGGVSVVSAFLIEPAGTPVPDGTVVQFFTTLGRIPEQGKTNDGVVRVNLTSDGRSGIASIAAFSGAVSASGGSASPSPGGSGGGLSVSIGSVLPTAVFVRADPPRITISRSTHIIATVLDANGNFVANVPVSFTIDDNRDFEYMDHAGSPLFTDSNGQADDVMRTRRTSSGTATVRATVLSGASGMSAAPTKTVEVPIFPE